MNLIIDYRERKLVSHFKDKPNVEIKNLDIGDIIFNYNGDLVLLIERKTVADLGASILDGRNREQKVRLMNCGIDTSKILYLIEGNLSKIYSKRMNSKTLLGSIVNTLIRDNLKVYKTANLVETILFIERIYDKLLKTPKKLLKQHSKPSTSGEINKNEQNDQADQTTQNDPEPLQVCYADSIKKKKKANMTPITCSIIQLSQIPSVSTAMAKVILDKYSSVINLCLEYSKHIDDITYCDTLVKELTFPIANSKTRRVGPKASHNLFCYLFNRDK